MLFPRFVAPAAATTLDVRTISSADDAEEYATAAMYLNSSDLELTHDLDDQTIGMRWIGLNIPPGATITAAWIQFAAKEAQSEVTTLTLQGQAADNPLAFTTVRANLSSRPRTTAVASWVPVAWTIGQAGPNQRTPDLSAVVQEIVSRPGWASGNALALIITGTGHRTAYAWDGSATLAPQLHIEYTTGPPPPDLPPVASLAVSQLANPPLTVTADGSGSTDTDITPIGSYSFDFGDGSPAVVKTAPTRTATHTYAAAGDYTVTLIATDTALQPSAPVTRLITVNPPPPDFAPVASVSAVQLASPPLTVTANGAGSTDTDVTPIGSYSFDFGDGTPAVVKTAPTTTATHTYAAEGDYTITLVATDTGAQASAPATTSIHVNPPPPDFAPIASVSAVQLASPALTVTADGTASTDTDATPIGSYSFDFGDGSPAVVKTAPTTTATHTYAAEGDYTITLVATDTGAQASAPATTSIHVNPPPPDFAPVASVSAVQLASPPLTVTADGAASTDTDATPIGSYSFDFGDGSPAVVKTAPTTAATHTYAAPGPYTITLIAKDTALQASAPATTGITVVAPSDFPPVASLAVAQLASPPFTINATGAGSTDTDLTPIGTYSFNFGDGSPAVVTTAPTISTTHTYAAAGSYTVTLVVTDTGLNASTPVTRNINVVAPTSLTLEKRVAASSDDAEQRSGGTVNISSNDLELIHDSNDQIVGMRWTGVTIPPASTITAAYIQFVAKEAQSEVTNLTLRGQAADNAATFTTGTNNISSRTRTATSVAWTPVAWTAGQVGANQRTPSLAGVLQEVVSRPGWASGNALAIIVEGTGHRTAVSYDGTKAQAPLLHIEYLPGLPPPDQPPVALLTAAQQPTPAFTVLANGSTSTDVDGTPIASYRFDFGDGTPPVTTTAPTATATHSYAAAGLYTVTLIVTDTGLLASAPVSVPVSVNVSAASGLAVYAGYYDTHHPDNPQPKPDPWMGSPGVTFVGVDDGPGGGWDSSGIRLDNLTSSAMTGVVVTCDMGSNRFALWGTRSIPAGGTLVLAQTAFQNFDGSDTNPAGCYGCDPTLCITMVQSTVPVIHVTIGGVTTDYFDTAQILNTRGVDGAGCPANPGRLDESHPWQLIFLKAGAALGPVPDAAGQPAPGATGRTIALALPYPNPVRGDLNLGFSLPKRGRAQLGIYDVAGRLVRMSIDRELDAGEYRNVVDMAGVRAGVYFCRLATAEGTLKRAIVVR